MGVVNVVRMEMVSVLRESVPVETEKNGMTGEVNPAEDITGYIAFTYAEIARVSVPTLIVVVSS